jgi:hypothetical protein
VTQQLALFDDLGLSAEQAIVSDISAEPNGTGRRGALPHGAPGLLKALLQRGLAEDALEAAAALIMVLDADAASELEAE